MKSLEITPVKKPGGIELNELLTLDHKYSYRALCINKNSVSSVSLAALFKTGRTKIERPILSIKRYGTLIPWKNCCARKVTEILPP